MPPAFKSSTIVPDLCNFLLFPNLICKRLIMKYLFILFTSCRISSFWEGMFSIASRRDNLCQPKATPWGNGSFFSFVALKGQLKNLK